MPFTVLKALAVLPLLIYLDVNCIDPYYDWKRDQEKEEQHTLQFFNGFLRGRDNNSNSNLSTETAKVEELTLFCVNKLTYTMLNILQDLTNLRKLVIVLDFSASDELLAEGSDNMCMNIDLHGVLGLLRKCKKLKKVVFENVKSSGEYLPSHYIKQKLDEQQDNFQLRKYIVKSGYSRRLTKNEMLFRSNLEIVNVRYI